MLIAQKLWTKEKGWEDTFPEVFPTPPQLVLAFGDRKIIQDKKYFDEIRNFYPNSHIIECSTAGEILGSHVRSGSIALSAILSEKTELHFAEINISNSEESFALGKKIGQELPKENLIHVMIFSDGLLVNGTDLVKGLNDSLPNNVSVTGGLVADGSDFKITTVGLDHVAETGKIVIVGFFGTKLKVGFGSFGGWDTFGIERKITKSKGNILFEIDGQPALELYKAYLGDKASGLPSTGLLFPLRMKINNNKSTETVRTILAVNEKEQSMTFAGDMPEGALVTLMKANFERLIEGASKAGNMSIQPFTSNLPNLAILISCVGRKLVLKERTEEEVEAVKSAIGDQAKIIGFYSYGELCPTAAGEKQCLLHNQTMTITTFKED